MFEVLAAEYAKLGGHEALKCFAHHLVLTLTF